MYTAYNVRPLPRTRIRRRKSKKRFVYILSILLMVGVYIAYATLRPLEDARLTIIPPVVPAQVKVSIPWPGSGQAAFGADGYGLLASKAAETPAPTASLAKIITALAVLEKKPLAIGQNGPIIPFTAADEQLYVQYLAKDGAVVPVTSGGSMTEYEALQAVLLPSANNIADSLAIWAFGSIPAYNAYANVMVKRYGLLSTTVSDASGFSPQTVSTPSDLVKLGDVALDHPVLSQIIAQPTAAFPGAGEIRNVNNFLGQSGVRGIKTGTTDEAGGCYLAAADVMVGSQKITVITAVMGSPTRPQAMRETLPLIQSAPAQFRTFSIVSTGQKAGVITTEWGGTTDIVTDNTIKVTTWNGTAVSPKITKKSISEKVVKGMSVGDFSITSNNSVQKANLVSASDLANPTLLWRLRNPL